MRGYKLHAIAASIAMVLSVSGLSIAACDADINGNGTVDAVDYLALIAGWGPCSGACPGDINGDGTVDAVDYLALIAGWGECPPATCPFNCLVDDFACIVIGSGVSHPEYSCDGGMTCCEMPELEPCPFSCMQVAQECSVNGGTQHPGYDCGGGICCDAPEREPCPYDCVPGMFECLISGGTDRLEFECGTGTCCEIP